MNKTFFEKMLEKLLVDLENYLPLLAGKLVVFLLVCFIWPKITKLILKALDRSVTLKNNDPLLLSFLKSLIKA